MTVGIVIPAYKEENITNVVNQVKSIFPNALIICPCDDENTSKLALKAGAIVPPRKKPSNERGYFEILSKAVFNAGFSYQVVNRKWEGIKEIFHDFDPKIISNWTVDEVSNALESPKIIRNSKKVNAIVSKRVDHG